MSRWIAVPAAFMFSVVIAGFLAPSVWANCGSCSKDAKAHEEVSSGCSHKHKEGEVHKTVAVSDKGESGCSKSAAWTADTGGCSKECAERAFSKLDANGDGKIDRAEFTGGMPALVRACASEHGGNACGAKGDRTVALTSASGAGGKPGCSAGVKSAGSDKCPKKTAFKVLAAFDLDGNGKLNAVEIERANRILLVVKDVSKAEHARLTAPGGCSKARETGTSIETLASRSYDSLQQSAETAAPGKPAAPPAGASSEGSPAGDQGHSG